MSTLPLFSNVAVVHSRAVFIISSEVAGAKLPPPSVGVACGEGDEEGVACGEGDEEGVACGEGEEENEDDDESPPHPATVRMMATASPASP